MQGVPALGPPLPATLAEPASSRWASSEILSTNAAQACVQPNGLHIRRHLLGQRAEGRGGGDRRHVAPWTQRDTVGLQAWGGGCPPAAPPAGTPRCRCF